MPFLSHTFIANLSAILIWTLCNAQQYNHTGVSWPTGSWLKHSDWVHLRLMDQSQELLPGHAIFASSEYSMTHLPWNYTFSNKNSVVYLQ